MAITDRHGIPVAVYVASASPHETRLVEATLEQSFAPHPPEKLMGDRAYDSDPLDQRLKREYGVDLIAPHKRNRHKPPTQDGRVLRRYCRRLEDRALLCLAAQLSPSCNSLGILRKQFPRHGSVGLHPHPAAQVFMRWLLTNIGAPASSSTSIFVVRCTWANN
jgi:hypothetical protein